MPAACAVSSAFATGMAISTTSFRRSFAVCIRAQRLAVNEFGDDVMRAVHLADFVNGDDVRMISCARRARLALETAPPFGVICERRRQKLERNLAMQSFVLGQ